MKKGDEVYAISECRTMEHKVKIIWIGKLCATIEYEGQKRDILNDDLYILPNYTLNQLR